jgi:protein SCO1/2
MKRFAAVPVLSLACLVLAAPAYAVKDEAKTKAKPTVGDTLGESRPAQPRELDGLEIKDKLGAKVPLDIELTDHTGAKVRLSKYFSGEAKGKPVLLTLGYYNCPMLCSLVINSTIDALRSQSLKAGEDFTWVSVSWDPEETANLAAAKRKNYLDEHSDVINADGWRFHVGDQAEVKRLADAVGFSYRWDERSKQWAHAAGIFFLSADGTLTRTLFGVSYEPTDVKFAVMEASNGTVGTITDQIFLSCFSYTPDKQRYGVYVFGVMRLAGVLTILLLGGFLFVLWRRERIGWRLARDGRGPASSRGNDNG